MKNILRPALLMTAILFAASNLFGQASYTGVIGNAPVTIVTNIYSDGVGTATYVYDEFDEPINLDGKVVKNKLTLTEKGANKLTRATLTFDKFDDKNAEMNGIWKDAKTGKTLDIKLKKDFEVTYGENAAAKGEFIQSESLPDRYFKVSVAGDRVVAVKVFAKRSDQLLQTINVDCQQRGADSISAGDFNFDGIQDFSIFEASAAGPNTSSLYYLYNPAKKQFFNSGFQGTSLEFDAKTKMISETNQCCAGTSVITAKYRVVKNKMVLVSERCFRWDEKKGAQVERPIRQCR